MGFFINMFFILILGRLTERILYTLSYRIRFLYPVVNVFLRLGVIFHELSHYIILKILLVPVSFSDIDFHSKDGGGGIDLIQDDEFYRRINFLKFLLVSVAPLWIGTVFIMESYNMFVNNSIVGYKIIAVVSIIIILFMCTPSGPDMRNIWISINHKPLGFLKQVFFLVIAFLVYNLYFDFFFQFAPLYPYLFEFLVLVILEGTMELSFMILKFISKNVFGLSNNKPIGYYKTGSSTFTMFSTRKQRKRIKQMEQSELFSLLPYDDETAAEEFAQAMIENNAMMIDIENPEEET